MKPIITVAICVKNTESTIGATVDSIINQNFSKDKLEIIVVDGNSTDNTLSILQTKFNKKLRQVTFFSENKGLGFARQIALENSKGKYIIWADGDLIFPPNYITTQYEFMEKNPKAAIVAGILGIIPTDNWIATLETIGYVVEGQKHVGKKTTNLLGTKGTISRTRAIKSVGGFDLDFKGSQEDIDLSYRLSLSGWNFYINNALYYENQRTTWNNIWKRHVWYGYGLHFLQHKHPNKNMISSKSNDRIIFSAKAYKITQRKIVFLLPLNFIFRKAAIFYGFLKAHLSKDGHIN